MIKLLPYLMKLQSCQCQDSLTINILGSAVSNFIGISDGCIMPSIAKGAGVTSWDPPDRPSMEMQARRPPEVKGKTAAAGTTAASTTAAGRAVNCNYAACISIEVMGESAGWPARAAAVAAVVVFPFCNTCAQEGLA